MLISCKKNSVEPPEGDPNNEIMATVSYFGGKDSIHKSIGNRTVFARGYSNGDSTKDTRRYWRIWNL